MPLHPLHPLICSSACFPSPPSSFSILITPHPILPGRWLNVQSWQAVSSPFPSTPFGFSECITNCPIPNTCTGIMPKSYLLHPTPKAINLQRAFLTQTASLPTSMHTHARTHTSPHLTPIFFFSFTFAKITQTRSNKCLKASFEECQGTAGCCRILNSSFLPTFSPIKFLKCLSRNK